MTFDKQNYNRDIILFLHVMLLRMYWQIEKLIVGNEQVGKLETEYCKVELRHRSYGLILEFKNGFNKINKPNTLKFYMTFQFATHCVTNCEMLFHRLSLYIDGT